MLHALHTFFSLPDGSIWPNILASGLVTAGGWVLGMWRFRVLHRRHEDRIHNHINSAISKVIETRE